jgi:hypothetical protein
VGVVAVEDKLLGLGTTRVIDIDKHFPAHIITCVAHSEFGCSRATPLHLYRRPHRPILVLCSAANPAPDLFRAGSFRNPGVRSGLLQDPPAGSVANPGPSQSVRHNQILWLDTYIVI